MSLNPGVQELLGSLRCPATGSPLSVAGDVLVGEEANRRYPIENGIPVLIDEEQSLFDIEHVVQEGVRARARPESTTGAARSSLKGVAGFILALPPTRARNVAARANYRHLLKLLRGDSPIGRPPRVLVVGGRTVGAGLQEILDQTGVDVMETDVALGPRTELVCDAHALPFADGTFDAVVIQAVLEQVVEPSRVASEIHRVLGSRGLVYSEAPFIQQVHAGDRDLHRFTHLGHRRLWRDFDEISSGAQCGPGMALIWSLEYFLSAPLGTWGVARALVRRVVTLGVFWLKYLDHFLASRPGGIDAASGTFFLGRRRDSPLSDREVLRAFRGVREHG